MSYGHRLLDLGYLPSFIWPETLKGIKTKANKLERYRKFQCATILTIKSH